MLVTCPGCLETYDSDLANEILIADFRSLGLDLQEPVRLEHYTAPDGTTYCTDECFIENGV